MILHVTTRKEWDAYSSQTDYAPAAFAQENFIHACYEEQLSGVLQRYFKGRHDLLLLHIDEQKLTSPVIPERSTNNELYPHIYGYINKNAIVEIKEVAA